jgi:NADPH-dependent ferric siderophore reductase
MAVDDPILDLVGKPGGPLADAALWSLTVSAVASITSDYRRVTFEGPGLDQLHFRAGQDLMLRIPGPDHGTTNRRYTIRGADPRASTVTIDMVVHGDGPGARWAGGAAPGQRIDAIGPRGKIWLDDSAEWHLFVGDETGLPGMSIMAETLPAGVPAVMVIELPRHVEEHDPELAADQDVTVTWIERGDDEAGEPARLVAAVEQIALPPGRGHAYVAGEMRVVRAVAGALNARGLDAAAVAAKAYWRRDSANAPHGEPVDPDGPRANSRG